MFVHANLAVCGIFLEIFFIFADNEGKYIIYFKPMVVSD